MITIYGRRNSFNVQKVLWLIEELALPCEQVDCGGAYGGLDNEGFLEMNPHGKVPVIVDNGTAIWESHAILRYLAAQYGGPQFWNGNPADRARIDQWIDWSQTTLQPAFLNGVFWGFYRTPEAERDEATILENIGKTEACLKKLDDLIARKPYLFGNEISLADIPAGTHLYRYFNLDIERPVLPNVERWYRSLQDRPGYRQHVMIPFDDLCGRLAH